jgi:succinate dehydrogenase/fumarate reductase cytochrome b subunit (b558 family)
MRAALCRELGPPEVVAVEDVESPPLDAGQVRVAVHAASVNFPDVLLVAGQYQLKVDPPFIPGSELAGVVAEVGEGVTGLSVGDRVLGTTLVGAFAEEAVLAATSLTRMNRRARPTGYQSTREYVSADFASRSMRITGVVILAYLIFHLFDLSWTGTGADWKLGHPHNNLIESLQRPWVAAIYAVANIGLAIHLFHGTWSMFQSMGLNNPRYNYARRLVAVGMSLIVGIPNVLFPLLIVTGVVK